MSRFNRDFELSITADGQTFVVKPPLRIAFDALKNATARGLSKATIQVFNLNERKRLAIVKDTEQNKEIGVSLKVGYDGSPELIFKGKVQRGSSRREGSDIVTELYCLDGFSEIKNNFISTTAQSDQIGAILKSLKTISRGKITEIQKLIRPKVLIGDAVTILNNLVGVGQKWFIDNETLFILKDNEVISSFIPEVSANTGLLNTPEREQSIITFETLMNPSLKLGGLCSIKSKFAPHLNGIYKIDAISYAGDNYGSAWQQTCTGVLQNNYVVI